MARKTKFTTLSSKVAQAAHQLHKQLQSYQGSGDINNANRIAEILKIVGTNGEPSPDVMNGWQAPSN